MKPSTPLRPVAALLLAACAACAAQAQPAAEATDHPVAPVLAGAPAADISSTEATPREAGAAQPAALATATPRPVGASTRAWLHLQRSGEQAGSASPIPGEIATITWKRHVDSFRHPIPETFAPVRVEQDRQ